VNKSRHLTTILEDEPAAEITGVHGTFVESESCGKRAFGKAYLTPDAPMSIASFAELEDIASEIMYSKGRFDVTIGEKVHTFRRNTTPDDDGKRGKLFYLTQSQHAMITVNGKHF
jgi:hypothetical protein